MKFSSSILTVLAIISLGLAVRLYRINQPLLEFFPPRQTQTAEITRNIYINDWSDFWTPKVRYFTGEPTAYVLEFPLYNGIVAILYHLFGPNVIWGRIASLVFFVLSSIIFYRLIKSSIIHHPSSIFALLFFTFSPLHILISRTFQPEQLALFLLLLSVYKKSWFIFSLAVLTKLPLALFAPVMFFSPSSRGTERHGNLNNIVKYCLSLLPSAVWYSRARSLNLEEHAARNFSLSNWFQPNLWLQPSWYRALFQIEHIWVLTTLGLLFFWLGFWQIILSLRGSPSASRGNLTPWLTWLASGLLYLFIFNYHAMTHEYYHIFLLPPLAVIMGIGFSAFLSRISIHSWKDMITMSIVIALVTLSLIKPAVEKIFRSPNNAINSEEITAYRYNLIKEF